MFDVELGDLVSQVLQVTPVTGLKKVQESLRQQGLVVQRTLVLHLLHRVDPVITTLRNARGTI